MIKATHLVQRIQECSFKVKDYLLPKPGEIGREDRWRNNYIALGEFINSRCLDTEPPPEKSKKTQESAAQSEQMDA